jgi:hypothetical protein
MNEETNDERVERLINKATCLGFFMMRNAVNINTSPEDREMIEHIVGWIKTLPKKAKLPTDASFLKQLGIKPVRLNSASRKKGGRDGTSNS